jgi:hypothetical protein
LSLLYVLPSFQGKQGTVFGGLLKLVVDVVARVVVQEKNCFHEIVIKNIRASRDLLIKERNEAAVSVFPNLGRLIYEGDNKSEKTGVSAIQKKKNRKGP